MIRRRAYLAGLLIGTPSVVATWVVRGTGSPFIGKAYPVLAVFLVVLAWGLWSRRLPVTMAEKVVVVVVTTFFLAHVAVIMHTSADLAVARSELLESGFPNVSLLFMFAYLAFDTRTALTVSLAIYTAFLTIIGTRLLPELTVGGQDLSAVVGYASGLAFLGAAVALLYALAQVKEQLAETRSTAEALDAIAHTDPLTGVANRRRLHLTLEQQLMNAARSDGDLAVILLDVDDFKRINDEYGHHTGDDVLRAIASTIQRGLRATDLLGRWGGEEFLILAPRTGAAPAHELAERCRAMLAAQHLEPVGSVTASFGVAVRWPGDTSDALLKRADDATYEAKRAGRNRVIAAQMGDGHAGVRPRVASGSPLVS